MVEETSATSSPTHTMSSPATTPASIPPVIPKARVRLTDQQLESTSRDELLIHWKQQDTLIDTLLTQATSHEVKISVVSDSSVTQCHSGTTKHADLRRHLCSASCRLNLDHLQGTEIATMRENEERLKQQNTDLLHREKILVRRLAAKEQEMQEYAGQLSEMKTREAPGVSALRSALLDPAVNLLLLKLRQELATSRNRVEETQNELSAWKFTPDSNTGKRLMAKCRLLYQENEELGRVIASGRVAKLEGELALQKSFSEEVKKSQSELDEFLQDLDEDVEGMQSTIYYLQQELRKAKESIISLEQEKKCNIVEPCGEGTSTNGIPLCNGDSSSDSVASIAKTIGNSTIVTETRLLRKRTTSEDSDDLPLIKKVRRDSGQSHYSDEEVELTNGELEN